MSEPADDAEVARIGHKVAARWARVLEMLGNDWSEDEVNAARLRESIQHYENTRRP